MNQSYPVDKHRKGHVEITRDGPDHENVWASCDLLSDERIEILEQIDEYMHTSEIPENLTIGHVTIDGDTITFHPRETTLEEFGR